MLDELRNKVADLWDKKRPQLIYEPVPVGRVDQRADYVPLAYGRHYLRLWLSHVYLANQTQYLKTWYPAVHSLIRFESAGVPIEFPTVADATRVAMTQANQTGDVVAHNYVLTPLIPFNNGTIGIDVGLSAVQGADHLAAFISTLSDFSSLLAVPQFSTALGVADPLARGLLGLLGSGGVHLALHDAFADGRVGGYRVVLRADRSQVNPDQLSVINDRLQFVNGTPLVGFDYLLFRLEVTEKGPDYRSLSTIQTPMRQANAALKDQEDARAEGLYRAAIVAAHEAPELTTADRRRVKVQLKDDFAELKQNFGFSGLVGGEYDLSESMKRAMTVDMALVQGEPAWDDLFDV